MTLRAARSRTAREALIGGLLFSAGAVSILTTLGIIAVLVWESLAFFRHVPVWEFLTGTVWTPLFTPQHFGVLPLLVGSILVALVAGLIAMPLGLGSAIYLSEFAPSRVREWLKPILEILAGVPSVVYGYFALTFVTPLLQPVVPDLEIFNALSAGIVVGIMVLPLIASLSEDAMSAVPRGLRQGAYALGATKFEVSTRVVTPAALSGIVASFILAISRAIGETMAVVLAAGMTPNLTLDVRESIQTLTAYIVQVSLGDTQFGSIEYQSIFAVGLLLFAVTLGMNIFGRWLLNRYREEYA
ncbi:MAG TPA: phosphate ABC transporter permease subunit PstC [Gemmatimonadota bacterium]|nr:phosphate ABC transporter permease subunit PstC [Gemmatimonadota bacterium]